MTSPPLRVLVLEDDDDVAMLVVTVLERRLGCEVRRMPSVVGFVEEMREFAPDVVVTDIEMPGGSGLDLITTARDLDPHLPIILMTAHGSVTYAVTALRAGADEFLQKPLSSADLIAAVERLGLAARRKRAARVARSVLAIGAHPDDVEIGVGGTLAAHAAAGDPITILTLSRGARGGSADDRQHESLAAAELLGARLFLKDLTDTAISNSDPTVGIIERVVAEVLPTTVYVHSRNDRHQDHRAVHEAAMVATRNVAQVGCYQSPSATIGFAPTRFVSIDGYVDAKLRLLESFASQSGIRNYLAPDLVRATARYWSRFGTGTHVEPLEMIRDARGIEAASEHAHRGRDQLGGAFETTSGERP
ncbi:response regulator [Agrococcus sp. ProA11]|uniref:response regulator n=1 Tax=Agrococcus chionoecetis TaxID=3153752 RepID=UPI0032613ADB